MKNGDFVDVPAILRDKFSISDLIVDARFDQQRHNMMRTTNIFELFCKHVRSCTIKEASENNYSAYTIAACYMNRLITSIPGDPDFHANRLGTIHISNQFADQLSVTPLRIPVNSLAGLPFVSSIDMIEEIRNLFEGKGGIWIGNDTSTTGAGRRMDHDCMALVAKKFVAFAVVQDIPEQTCISAEINRVHLVKYQTRPRWSLPHQVTIAARSRDDLVTICKSIDKYTQFPTLNISNPQKHIVVISLGFKGYWTDDYLYRIGLELRKMPSYSIIFYFQDLKPDEKDLQNYFNDKIFYDERMKLRPHITKFKMGSVRGSWSFALTHCGKVDGLPTFAERVYQLTIPVAYYDDYSYQLNRNNNKHSTLTVWDVARDLETCHNLLLTESKFIREQQAEWEREREVELEAQRREEIIRNRTNRMRQLQEMNRQQIQHGNRPRAQYGNQHQAQVGNDQQAPEGNRQRIQVGNQQQAQERNRQQIQHGNQQQVRVGNWQQIREGNDQQAREAFQQRVYQGDEERERIRYQNNLRQRNMERIRQRARGQRNREFLN